MKFTRLFLIAVLGLGIGLAADVGRGKQLLSEGKNAEAEKELRAAVRDDDSNAAAHRLLGLALIEQDKASEAAGHIEKAMQLEDSGESKLALARLRVAQKDYGKAEEALNGASGDDLEYVRGLVHLHQQHFDEAAKDLEAYIEKNPEHAYAHYYAGLAYNGAKRPDKMLSHFQTFVNKKPDAPEARKVRAVLKTGR